MIAHVHDEQLYWYFLCNF